MAIKLKRQGIKKVRPLHGGFQKWLEMEFPTDKPENAVLSNQK